MVLVDDVEEYAIVFALDLVLSCMTSSSKSARESATGDKTMDGLLCRTFLSIAQGSLSNLDF